MTTPLTGNLCLGGTWIQTNNTFAAAPASGLDVSFSEAGDAEIDQAVKAAECVFEVYGSLPNTKRADFLRAIAEELDARGDAITETAMKETHLPEGRLNGERGRTTGQLRLFADHIEKGDYLEPVHNPALPDRTPLPRPDLRRIQRPIGPVAVFGASNFPLAFSVAGGDTASALAAGCPVIVRAHPAHPGTSELAGQAIDAAAKRCGIPEGVFSLLQGSGHELGAALVQHPGIQAVGFTGSLGGGRALFNLCAARPVPIPFFGEMGSINPVFLLPSALQTRGAKIAEGWVASLTMGVGQFCTNPGVVFLPEGDAADRFEQTVQQVASSVASGTMLTEGMAKNHRKAVTGLSNLDGVRMIVGPSEATPETALAVGSASLDTWLSNPELSEEVFGPFGLIVRVPDANRLPEAARALDGQLTCTIHLEKEDHKLAAKLLPILERKAGRLLANGFPTGVDVCDAMVHGGPYPASTNFGGTSVGTLAIRRFLRPVCYQDLPENLLPAAWDA